MQWNCMWRNAHTNAMKCQIPWLRKTFPQNSVFIFHWIEPTVRSDRNHQPAITRVHHWRRFYQNVLSILHFAAHCHGQYFSQLEHAISKSMHAIHCTISIMSRFFFHSKSIRLWQSRSNFIWLHAAKLNYSLATSSRYTCNDLNFIFNFYLIQCYYGCGMWQNVKLIAQVAYCKTIFSFYFLIWYFDGAFHLWCYEQWQLWTRLQYVNAQLWQFEGRNVKSGKSAGACRRQHTIASRHSILVYQSVSSVIFYFTL